MGDVPVDNTTSKLNPKQAIELGTAAKRMLRAGQQLTGAEHSGFYPSSVSNAQARFNEARREFQRALDSITDWTGDTRDDLRPVSGSGDLILEALLKVRETGNAGRAGPYVHRLPKDADRNWGWLQGQWGVVLAVDVVQQAYADQMSQLRELAERAHTYGPDEFGAFKRELHKILGELTD